MVGTEELELLVSIKLAHLEFVMEELVMAGFAKTWVGKLALTTAKKNIMQKNL